MLFLLELETGSSFFTVTPTFLALVDTRRVLFVSRATGLTDFSTPLKAFLVTFSSWRLKGLLSRDFSFFAEILSIFLYTPIVHGFQ